MKVERIFAGPTSSLSGLTYKIALRRNFKEVMDWCGSTLEKNAWAIRKREAWPNETSTTDLLVYLKGTNDVTVFMLRWS